MGRSRIHLTKSLKVLFESDSKPFHLIYQSRGTLILTAFLIANTSASFDSFAPIVHEKTQFKKPPIPFVFGFPNYIPGLNQMYEYACLLDLFITLISSELLFAYKILRCQNV
jgi:hypothetical protein